MTDESRYAEQDFSAADKFISERQTFQRRPKKAVDILTRLMARKGYGQQLAANELQEVWNQLMPADWQSQTGIGNLKQGVLEIIVTSPGLRQRLEFEKKQLLNQLQQQLPQNNIREIRFRIGNLHG
jgi:hypothetical protein